MEFDEDIDIKKQNVYADNVKGESIHISQAESGQKGYFCQGCKKELQAVKHKVPNRIDYFRHVAQDVKIERKCVYSDQTYRHKLAKELLARLKHIKVPAIYKYPPKGEEGQANLLAEAVLLEAHSVEMERTFYEDESGEIKWGSGTGIEEKYLLIRPDVVFFDQNKNPILFIELVATHKVDNEKKAKLRRLGIDAVELVIPKDSPEAIEGALYSAKHIKWIYNNVAESTKYIPIPIGTSEGVPSVDEQQKRLLTETFECRQAEIRNLIRTISRVLESKQYREIAGRIGEELSRVKENSEEHQSKLDGIREESRSRAFKIIEPEEEGFRKEFEDFEQKQADFQHYCWDLETRYFTKRKSLETKQSSIDRITNGQSEGGGGIKGRIARRRAEIERLTAELQVDIGKEESEIDNIQREEDGLPKRFEQLRNELVSKFANLETNEKREMEELGLEEAGLPKEFEEKEGKLPGEFERDKEQLRIEFEGAREDLDKAAHSRDGKGNTQLHFGIRGLLETKKLLNDISKVQSDYRRNRKAWECFKDGSYENWHK